MVLPTICVVWTQIVDTDECSLGIVSHRHIGLPTKMKCCFGAKEGCDKEPPYRNCDEETTSLLGRLDISGSRYSSAEEFLNHRKSVHDNKVNLWTHPGDVTHSIEEDDRDLMTLLQETESCDCPQRSHEIINKIEAIRQSRRHTLRRWKRVLLNLGFDEDADRLLDVQTTTTHNSDTANLTLSVSVELHYRLSEESDIFGMSSTQPARYIAVLDRLQDLDVAESFVFEAIKLYPKETGP